MCGYLLYDSIEEISVFNNLQSIYFECAITGEERWKILREFPRCEITVDEMNDKKDDEDTSEPEPFEGYYEYAITDEPLTEENIEKCRISYEVLATMTTEQVAQAVVDYPFIDELYSASQETFDAMILRRNCDAYAEILMRKDGREVLVDKILESEDGDYNIDLLKKIVLSEKLYADEFTEDELYFLDYFTNLE